MTELLTEEADKAILAKWRQEFIEETGSDEGLREFLDALTGDGHLLDEYGLVESKIDQVDSPRLANTTLVKWAVLAIAATLLLAVGWLNRQPDEASPQPLISSIPAVQDAVLIAELKETPRETWVSKVEEMSMSHFTSAIRKPDDGLGSEEEFREIVRKLLILDEHLQRASEGEVSNLARVALDSVKMKKNTVVSFSQVAWIIATIDSVEYPLELAERFVTRAEKLLGSDQHSLTLDARAAIHAANGEWKEAVAMQEAVIEEVGNPVPLILKVRLEAYKKELTFQRSTLPKTCKKVMDWH